MQSGLSLPARDDASRIRIVRAAAAMRLWFVREVATTRYENSRKSQKRLLQYVEYTTRRSTPFEGASKAGTQTIRSVVMLPPILPMRVQEATS